MDKLRSKQSPSNVNDTLEAQDPTVRAVSGRKIPCQLCGGPLEIRISFKQKPYCICPDCGIQTFYRGKKGIQRLNELLDREILVAGSGGELISAVVLFNRLQQLRAVKKELEAKQGLIILDPDLMHAIQALDYEMKSVQGVLKKISQKGRPGKIE
jgi:hypothetical protein